jgi:hypothetical protein
MQAKNGKRHSARPERRLRGVSVGWPVLRAVTTEASAAKTMRTGWFLHEPDSADKRLSD